MKFTHERKRELVQLWKSSSIRKVEFCREHGISIHAFNYWIKTMNKMIFTQQSTPVFTKINEDKIVGGYNAVLFEIHYNTGTTICFRQQPDSAFIKSII